MYLLLGCGSVGYSVAKQIKSEVAIVEKSSERADLLESEGFRVIKGNFTTKTALKKAKLGKAKAVLILTSDPEVNKRAIEVVREINKEVPIIVRSNGLGEDFGEDVIVIEPFKLITDAVIRNLREVEIHRMFNRFKRIILETTRMAIVLQNNPDPDAIACGLTLKRIVEHFGKKAEIIYGDEIGHEENKALVNLLGIKLLNILEVDLRDFSHIALVDTAIPGENNPLPTNVVPDIVIDHHPVDMKKVKAKYIDIRPDVGATSTILTEYLVRFKIDITEELATVLLYGIKTDTQDFMRGATPEDLKAVVMLYPKANHEILAKIETPAMSAETLDVLAEAIRNRRIEGSVLLSNVGFIRNRDTLPQAADYLLNLEGISTVVVYGLAKDVIHVSGRNKDIRIHLGEVMERAFGEIGEAGGHARAAAAKIPLGLFGSVTDKDTLLKLANEAIIDRFLKALGMKKKE
ncbi:MAG: potassium transporter TrkA [Candidatus Hydrothermarchaeota archaeon]|nr:MAG: potassium transporter TrkA [Candidatus Hydrothermarchaeota archaeon]